MPTGLDIELVGNQNQVDRMLTFLEGRLSTASMLAFLGVRIEPYLKERIDARFRSEGDDVTGPWRPLAARTQEIREWGMTQGLWDVAPDHPINQRTHEMFEFLTQDTWQKVGGPDLGAVRLSSPRTGKKSLMDKLKTAAGRRPGTPARPVLGMNEKDLSYVMVQLAFHIKSGSMRA